jgi:hypothetical protein
MVDNGSMFDQDIRHALKAHLARVHSDEEHVVIDELGLCQGDARADVVLINGALNGFEIKSDRDTLARLSRQRHFYGHCFETMTIVVGAKHVAAIRRSVPKWWGIMEATDTSGTPVLRSIREPQPNNGIRPKRVARLLWKSELHSILIARGLRFPKRAKNDQLINALVATLKTPELLAMVRNAIKARGDWRVGPSPFRCGDLRKLSATSAYSQANRRWLLSRKSSDLQG